MTTRLHIRFGQAYHWAPRILEFLDANRFACEFGPPDPARLEGVDAFVPLTLDDIRAVHDSPPHWRSKSLVPDPALLDLADSKPGFYRHLEASGFRACIPQVFDHPPHFPVIAKAAHGSNGEGVTLLHDMAQWHDLLTRCPREDILLTDYVAGHEEFAFHFLAVRGRVLWSQLVRHDHSDARGEAFVRGQNDIVGSSALDCETAVPRQLFDIVGHLRFTGTGCFDFKLPGGVPKLFELNPRPGYSIAMCINDYLEALLAAKAHA